jgi:hypothetical protein
MIDHIYLAVTEFAPSVQFYEALITPLNLAHRWNFNGRDSWPDLYGFGGDGPGFWLKSWTTSCPELYMAFTATSKAAVEPLLERAGMPTAC